MTHSSQVYTRDRHIRSRADFALALRSKSSVKGDCFRLYLRPSPSRRSRLGIIVPKRVERTAVRRNRVKRLIREVFRREATLKPALDIVVRLEKTVPGGSWKAAASVLAAMFRTVARDAVASSPEQRQTSAWKPSD